MGMGGWKNKDSRLVHNFLDVYIEKLLANMSNQTPPKSETPGNLNKNNIFQVFWYAPTYDVHMPT